MSKRIRVLFMSIFILFFLVTAAFIVVKTLGYSVDLTTGSLQKASTLRLDTHPSGAQVTLNGTILDKKTATELVIPQNAQAQIMVTKDGFADQEWTLNALDNQLSYTRLDDVFLLPNKPRTISQFTANESQFLFLNSSTLAYQKNQTWYTSAFSVNTGAIGSRPLAFSQYMPAQPIVDMVFLDENHAWSGQYHLLFVLSAGTWAVYPVVSNEPIVQVVPLDGSKIAFLTIGGNVWVQDLRAKNSAVFWDSHISALSSTAVPAAIWVLQRQSLYQFEPSQFDRQFVDKSHLFATDPLQNAPSAVLLRVTPFFQGFLVHAGTMLWYIPEGGRESWRVLADDAVVSAVSTRAVYWTSDKDELYFEQFELHSRQLLNPSLGIPLVSTDRMEYSLQLKRLVWHTQAGVYSVFHDSRFLNERIIRWQVQQWVSPNSICTPSVADFRLFCITGSLLQVYENKQLFF